MNRCVRILPLALSLVVAAVGAARGEAPLPEGALARLGSPALNHGTNVRAINFAAPETLISLGGTSSADFSAKAWQAETGQLLGEASDFGAYLMCMATDPSTSLVAVGQNNGQIRILSSEKGLRKLRTIKSPDGSSNWMQFGPEGKKLVVFSYRGVWVFDPQTGKELTKLDIKGFRGSVSPDGKQMAVATHHVGDNKTRGSILICQLPSGKQVQNIAADGNKRWSWAGYSSDGKLLAGISIGASTEVQIWDAETFKPVRTLKGHGSSLLTAAASQSGNLLVTSSHDRTVRVWDMQTGKEIRKFETGAAVMSHVAFSPEGKYVAAAGGYGITRIWRISDGVEVGGDRPHLGPLRSVQVSPNGKWAVSTDISGHAVIWDMNTHNRKHKLSLSTQSVELVRFSPDSKTLMLVDASGNGGLYQVQSAKEIGKIHLGNYPAGGGFDHDGKNAFVLTADRKWYEIPVEKPAHVKVLKDTLPALDQRVAWYRSAAAISPDRRWSAWPNNQILQLADSSTGRFSEYEIGISQHHSSYGYGLRQQVQFSPHSNSLAVILPRAIHVVEVDSARKAIGFDKPDNAIYTSVDFSPTGRLLAAGMNDGRIRILDLTLGKTVRTLQGHYDKSQSRRSSNRQYLGPHRQLTRPQAVMCLAVSPAGDVLLSAAADSSVLVWPMPGSDELSEIPASGANLESDFAAQASRNTGSAYAASWRLIRSGDAAVDLISAKLSPAEDIDRAQVTQWIQQLNAGSYRRRLEAHGQLGRMGAQALPILRRTLEENPPQEVAMRIRQLIENTLRPSVESAVLLQQIRAIRICERIDTDKARRLLRSLAGGSEASRLTVEARAALERMDR
ncbi:MAG: WD40 repeat domain-containing protein [Phycisphaerae bacterium]